METGSAIAIAVVYGFLVVRNDVLNGGITFGFRMNLSFGGGTYLDTCLVFIYYACWLFAVAIYNCTPDRSLAVA